MGNTDMNRVCTSHVERHNFSTRMQIRRFTRLTNGFSGKLENHEAALGLYFAAYNFVTKHGTIKTTPAVTASIASKPWTMADLDRPDDRLQPAQAANGAGGVINCLLDDE